MPRFDIISGRLVPDVPLAYAIVRNEMFYMPAFLDHYRGLGIEQFIFLDDKSTDGTREFLCGQPDCMVIGTRRRFGDRTVRLDGWKPRKIRCGIRWKTDIPRRFAVGRWALYLDADEFLVLPPGVNSIPELCDSLDRQGSTAVAATMVEFYPESLDDLKQLRTAERLADILDMAPYFDAVPIVSWDPESKRSVKFAPTTTRRLFHKHGLAAENEKGSPGKVPLVRWISDRYYRGSHSLNVPPDSDAMLCLLHFKFTPDLYRKIEDALKTQAYSGKSRKYKDYVKLFERMQEGDSSFLGEHSRRLRSVNQLVGSGLLSAAVTRRESRMKLRDEIAEIIGQRRSNGYSDVVAADDILAMISERGLRIVPAAATLWPADGE